MPNKEGQVTAEQDPYVELLKRQIKRADTLTTEHLTCRRGALGHHWMAVQPDFKTNVRGAVPVAYQCQGCLCIKRGVVSKRFGEWLANPSIEYPDGYLLSKAGNEPTVSAQSVRAAFVARVQSDIEGLPEMIALEHHHEPHVTAE
jgi:hypothetical protein